MGQLSVADEEAEASRIEIRFVYAGDAIDDAGEAERIARAAPCFTREREPGRHCPVDVGEFVGFDIAVGPACASEHAEVRYDLLLHVQADAPAAGVAADQCRI